MELTGRKVLFITVAAFSVVIAVNVTLAVLAVGTFPGLEVRNSYVASQTFDADRAAQEALGWKVDAVVEDGVLTMTFLGRNGYPVEVRELDATVGRPTQVRDDVRPDFSYRDGVFTAPVDLAPGFWDIRFVALAPDGTSFRQRIELRIE
ncbi:FixH family protein [Tropicimonas sp.]|uniref:FixH family protein n=1 Tax=Tropicimonas sp. TaxID=2067044 RepID=UPI003A89F256